MATCYLAFVCRIRHCPLNEFPVLLSQQQVEAVDNLDAKLAKGSFLHTAIHRLTYSLLSSYHPDTVGSETKCPLRKFLVLVFLNNNGTFVLPHHITPHLSRMQYFFRAVGVVHAYQERDKHADDVVG